MRRKDRELPQEEALKILERGEYGILSTKGDTYPYAVPVHYAVADSKIVIHGTTEESLRVENIKKHRGVCFTVVGRTEVLPDKFAGTFESAVVFGKADFVEGAEKQRALEKIVEKYSFPYREEGKKYIAVAFDSVAVMQITMEQITGKANR